MMASLLDAPELQEYRNLIGPTAEDKRGAGLNALLALGLGLMGNRSPYFGVALGNAGFGAMNTHAGSLDMARQGRQADVQGALGLRKLKQEMERERRLKELFAGLPENERALAELAPEKFVGAKAETMFPKPTDFQRDLGMVPQDKQSEAILQKFGLAPKVESPTSISKLWAEYEATPVGHPKRAVLLNAINKESSHGPGASVSVGLQAPVMMQNPDGSYSMYQPANKPGYGPEVTQLPAGVKPAATDRPPTAENLAASGYSLRMKRAEQIMDELEAKGESGAPKAGEIIGANIPLIGGPMLANAARSETRQLSRQAQEDWVRAKLRKESGAVISPEEMDREITTYFPEPFQGKKVRDQKRKARQTAIEAMEMSATGKLPTPSQVPSDVQSAARKELERRRQQGGR
jgi:hypothetical protein